MFAKSCALLILACAFTISAQAQENLIPELIRSETIVSGSLTHDIGAPIYASYGYFATASGAKLTYYCIPQIGNNGLSVQFTGESVETDKYTRNIVYFRSPMTYSVCRNQLHLLDAAIKSGKQIAFTAKGFEENHLKITFSEIK